eukprot:c6842_g1_i1.p1 GENE.c6842_g1_i1~~c6842_g1_i1.p1  ORF type:complete len:700 (-),score=156.48 c6842_g1_i1:18-2117(-)
MSDPPPASVKRSNTLEKLANLVREKQAKQDELRAKREARQAETVRREAEHQKFLESVATPRNDGTHPASDPTRTSTPVDTHRHSIRTFVEVNVADDEMRPALPQQPGEAVTCPQHHPHHHHHHHHHEHHHHDPAQSHAGKDHHRPPRQSNFENVAKDDDTQPQSQRAGVRFVETIPHIARGVSKAGVELTRSVSRGAMASARHISRTISIAGTTSARLSRSISRVIQDDRQKMIRNAVLRQLALKHEIHKQRTNNEGSATSGSIPDTTTPSSSLPRRRRGLSISHEPVSEKEKLRIQLENRMKGRKPWFARVATFTQMILLIAMMSSSRLAPWGISVSSSAIVVPLFLGSEVQEITTPQNPFFGPDASTLVAWGSKWSPCMRQHNTVLEIEKQTLELEKGYGCCANIFLECGMMDNATCASFGGTFSPGQLCDATPSCQAITVRPCCFGILGQCAELTKRHCEVLRGVWNEHHLMCGESKCLKRQCGMTDAFETRDHPNQFYRFVTAMFLHVGVIHFVMNALGQYILVAQVEFVAGWVRTGIMYVMSGAFGFLISALFSSDSLSNGSSAAIYGMLGVETVDLFQTWQLLDSRKTQVLGLVLKLVIFLGIGTLPYIDNFAHIGGFIAGVVAAICLMPHISFSRLDAARKLVLQILSVLALIGLAAGLLFKFYTAHEILCGWCQYANCVPYTHNMCRNTGS